MKRYIAFLMALWSLMACQHGRGRGMEDSLIWSATPTASGADHWLEYMAALDAMNPREFKLEADRARKAASDSRAWEDELRWSLIQIVQQQRAKNFQKAAEILSQLPQRAQWTPEVKAWVKLYQQQLMTVAQLDKELQEEKRLRTDLEKKLKGLSDIELDISQRDKKSQAQ